MKKLLIGFLLSFVEVVAISAYFGKSPPLGHLGRMGWSSKPDRG